MGYQTDSDQHEELPQHLGYPREDDRHGESITTIYKRLDSIGMDQVKPQSRVIKLKNHQPPPHASSYFYARFPILSRESKEKSTTLFNRLLRTIPTRVQLVMATSFQTPTENSRAAVLIEDHRRRCVPNCASIPHFRSRSLCFRKSIKFAQPMTSLPMQLQPESSPTSL